MNVTRQSSSVAQSHTLYTSEFIRVQRNPWMLLTLTRDSGKLIRTIDKAAKTIQEKTGWSTAIFVCGPDPKKGGDVHVVG